MTEEISEDNTLTYDPGKFAKLKEEKVNNPGINTGSQQEVVIMLEKLLQLKYTHASTNAMLKLDMTTGCSSRLTLNLFTSPSRATGCYSSCTPTTASCSRLL